MGKLLREDPASRRILGVGRRAATTRTRCADNSEVFGLAYGSSSTDLSILSLAAHRTHANKTFGALSERFTSNLLTLRMYSWKSFQGSGKIH